MRTAQLLATAGFAIVLATWLGLSSFYFYRYVRPLPTERRRPQTPILAASCLGWVAFLLSNRGYLTHEWVRTILESVAACGAVLALMSVYVYESQPKRNTRMGSKATRSGS